MRDTPDIHPLSEFVRKLSSFRNRLRISGRPALLTVEGRPAFVVQDAAAYAALLDRLDAVDDLQAIEDGLAEIEAGKGIPAKDVLTAVRRQLRKSKKS